MPLEVGLLSRVPPPRRYLLRQPTADGLPCAPGCGDGFLPRGKAGLFTAAGGVGKTFAVVQVALSVATGRPWLGHFAVDAEAHDCQAKVLLALAEEDAEEIHRRMYAVAEAIGLTAEERRMAEDRIVAMPLAGRECGLLTYNPLQRRTTESSAYTDMRAELSKGEWALIVIDPLARFAGVPIDLDNSVATRVVQTIESLVELPGAPTVLVVHHSSKGSRKEGGSDSRGATAIPDGLRWGANLTEGPNGLVLTHDKASYSVRMQAGLRLDRGAHGVLQAASGEAAEMDTEMDRLSLIAMAEAMADRAVQALEGLGGRASTKNVLAERMVGKRSAKLAGIDLAVSQGRIVDDGRRLPRFLLRVCVQESSKEGPGNREPVVPVPSLVLGGSPGTKRNQKEPGTSAADEGLPEQPGRQRKRKPAAQGGAA